MVFGPAAPSGSTTDGSGNTVVNRPVYGPAAPIGSTTDRSGNTIVSGGGGGGGRGGGNGSSGPSQAQIAAAQAAEQKRQAELQRKQEESRRLAAKVKSERDNKIDSQKIGGQVNLKDNTATNQNYGTIQNYGVKNAPSNIQVYTEPTIEKRTTGSFVDVNTGKNIPTSSYFLIEPPAYGSGGGVVKETKIKPSAINPSGAVFNIEGYEQITVEKELDASTDKRNIYDKTKSVVVGAYEKAESKSRKAFTDPLASLIVESTKGTSFGGETGLTLEKAKSNIRESTDLLISKGAKPGFANTGEFISGVGVGIVEDVRYKPGKQVAILAATAGLGYGLSAGTVGVTSATTKLFGASAGLYTGVGLKTAQIGAGAILGGGFAINIGGEVITKAKAGDYLGAGSTLGVASKDLAIGAYGFKSGQKLFTQSRGLWATKGRDYLEIKQGDYPQAPTSKQVKMFKENVIPELGAKPGAFHTTSEVFYKGGKIVPSGGSSELPGLYGSTQISKPFARISGSGDKGNILAGLKNWKNMFKVEGKPGVAYLQPEEFRYSPAIKDPNFQAIKLGGGKFLRTGTADYPYKFVNPPKPGAADVPLIKSEIEAIFRPGAGEYGLSSGKYYTNIKGVRVPIDVFGYAGPTGSTPVVNLKVPTYSSGASKGYYSGAGLSSASPSIGLVTSIVSKRSSGMLPPSSSSLISSYKLPSSYGSSYGKPSSSASYIYGSSGGFGSSSGGSGSSSSASYIFGGSSSGSSSSSGLLPARPGGLLPKFPKIHEKAKRKIDLFNQPTQYQTSFSGSILKVKGKGLLPGGLSVRGII